MQKELYIKFLDMLKQSKRSSVGSLAPKQKSWWKKSIPTNRSPLSYHTDGLRVFVDIEYLSEEKFM